MCVLVGIRNNSGITWYRFTLHYMVSVYTIYMILHGISFDTVLHGIT